MGIYTPTGPTWTTEMKAALLDELMVRLGMTRGILVADHAAFSSSNGARRAFIAGAAQQLIELNPIEVGKAADFKANLTGALNACRDAKCGDAIKAVEGVKESHESARLTERIDDLITYVEQAVRLQREDVFDVFKRVVQTLEEASVASSEFGAGLVAKCDTAEAKIDEVDDEIRRAHDFIESAIGDLE